MLSSLQKVEESCIRTPIFSNVHPLYGGEITKFSLKNVLYIVIFGMYFLNLKIPYKHMQFKVYFLYFLLEQTF